MDTKAVRGRLPGGCQGTAGFGPRTAKEGSRSMPLARIEVMEGKPPEYRGRRRTAPYSRSR